MISRLIVYWSLEPDYWIKFFFSYRSLTIKRDELWKFERAGVFRTFYFFFVILFSAQWNGRSWNLVFAKWGDVIPLIYRRRKTPGAQNFLGHLQERPRDAKRGRIQWCIVKIIASRRANGQVNGLRLALASPSLLNWIEALGAGCTKLTKLMWRFPHFENTSWIVVYTLRGVILLAGWYGQSLNRLANRANRAAVFGGAIYVYKNCRFNVPHWKFYCVWN